MNENPFQLFIKLVRSSIDEQRAKKPPQESQSSHLGWYAGAVGVLGIALIVFVFGRSEQREKPASVNDEDTASIVEPADLDIYAAGPKGEEIKVGGDGLGSNWYFHYFNDHAGNQVMHGTSMVMANGRNPKTSLWNNGTLIMSRECDESGKLIRQYKHKGGKLYELDEYDEIGRGTKWLVSISKTESGSDEKRLERLGALTPTKALRRQDIISLLTTRGAIVGPKHERGGYQRIPLCIRASITSWTDVVGSEPEILSDEYDTSAGGRYQRWRWNCIDGPLTFHGNILTLGNGETQLQSVVACFY